MLLHFFLTFSTYVKLFGFCVGPPILFPTATGVCGDALMHCALSQHLYMVYNPYLMWLGVCVAVQVVADVGNPMQKSALALSPSLLSAMT